MERAVGESWKEESKHAIEWEEEFIEPFRPGSNVPLDPFMNHIPATASIAFLVAKKEKSGEKIDSFYLPLSSFSFFFPSISSARNPA